MTDPTPQDGTRREREYWIDRPRNVDRIFYGLCLLCLLLFLVDPLIQRHPHFPLEGSFGFYAWYGFVGCVFLVLAAKQMRRVLLRDEKYYDR